MLVCRKLTAGRGDVGTHGWGTREGPKGVRPAGGWQKAHHGQRWPPGHVRRRKISVKCESRKQGSRWSRPLWERSNVNERKREGREAWLHWMAACGNCFLQRWFKTCRFLAESYSASFGHVGMRGETFGVIQKVFLGVTAVAVWSKLTGG